MGVPRWDRALTGLFVNSPEFRNGSDSAEGAIRVEERGPANLVYVAERPKSDLVRQVIAPALEANAFDATVENALVMVERF